MSWRASALALILVVGSVAHAPKAKATQSGGSNARPRPTVFQADEGDRWLLLGEKPLIFKVDPVTTGSESLVVGTEEMPPGNRIPTHKHLHEDEVVYILKGTLRAMLADHTYEARAGATIFIPQGTWIGLENASPEPAMILFFFNKPAFEKCLRARSSRPGEKFTMPPREKMAAVTEQCHQVIR
jgi:quercetin dioxygenase-like cupin family protein